MLSISSPISVRAFLNYNGSAFNFLRTDRLVNTRLPCVIEDKSGKDSGEMCIIMEVQEREVILGWLTIGEQRAD